MDKRSLIRIAQPIARALSAVSICTLPITVKASYPLAPFTAPEIIVIPNGFPSGTIPPQIFQKADWLSYPGSIKENFRGDSYVGLSRRRGNIVSLYVLRRTLFRNHSVNSNHIPRHKISIVRYDCSNDQYQSDFQVIYITDAIGDGPEVKGGFLYPLNTNETKWDVIPGQVRVTIEGYPYWAMRPSSDPRYEKITNEWIPIKLGTNGAFQLDYACENY